MRQWMRVAAVAAMAGAALLAGCGGGKSSSGNGQLRLLNATSGYGALDLQLAGAAVTGDTGLGYGAVGSYAAVADSGVATAITSSSNIYYNATPSFSKNVNYTLVAYGSPGALKAAIVAEDVAAPGDKQSTLVVRNFAPSADKVDVYLTSTGTAALTVESPLARSVAGSGSVALTNLSAGTYRLWVTRAGDITDLRLVADGLVLGNAQVSSLILTETAGGTPVSGGVLVNALQVVQGGAVTALPNKQARVRLVTSLPSSATVTASAAGTPLAAGPIGNYTLVTGSTAAPVVLTVNGTAVPVANQALTAGGDYTLAVWGDPAAGGVQTALVADDNRLPLSATNAKIRLVNLTYGTSTAYTLLTDSRPSISNVQPGVAAPYVNVTPNSTMQLEVDPAGGGNAVFQTTSTGKPVSANTVWTVFLRGDAAAPVGLALPER